MKKKLLTLSTIALSSWANAQIGNVGINTQTPTETLNVNGTLRINELPIANGKIHTTSSGSASAAKDQNFTPTKMVVVDNNGVVGKADIPSSGAFYQGSTSVALEGNSFQRQALTGDVTADKNSNTTKVVAIQNKPVSTTAPTNNQVLQWDGTQWTPASLYIPTLPKDPELGTGTVIAINGQVKIAEEITATMANEEVLINNSNNNPQEIPHLTRIIINNQKLFTATDKGNSFKVSQSGTYQIIMNVYLSSDQIIDKEPVVGIWNNNINKWIARITNKYNGGNQTFTLITTADLTKDTTYSFRVAHSRAITIHGYSSGSTGEGPATFISVKQLR
ncbi:hypothetical protein [Bergeyella porcorum]